MKIDTSTPFAVAWVDFPSSLGWILLAATDTGICLLHLLPGGPVPPDDAERIIRNEYPPAIPRRDETHPPLPEAKDALLRYLETGDPLPPLPVDIRKGSAFRRSVWDALLRIPHGQTCSYGDIAKEIGSPLAARAVGAACGANPVALIIPCHRVVASDGSLGGYSGGLPVKGTLLALERRFAH